MNINDPSKKTEKIDGQDNIKDVDLIDFSNLMKKAKDLVNNRSSIEKDSARTIKNPQETIHELEVYQAELEIQNEELRSSQLALMASRNRFFNLYHHAPMGYLSINESGCISEVNQRFATMLKMPMEKLNNKPLANFIFAADRNIFLGRFRSFYTQPENKSIEVRMVCKDHSVFYALLAGRKIEHETEDDGKACQNVLLIITDISDRHHAYANLRLADKMIQTVQESLLVTDKSGLIINVNAYFEEKTGYSKDEAIGKSLSMLESGRQDKRFYRAMWKILTNTGLWRGIVWYKRKNGEEYAEKLTINAIYGGHHEITHFVGVFTDVSDQLKLEEKLLHAQKMETVGSLVGGISHAFNNILAGILGSVYLAKIQASEQPKLLNDLDTIEKLGNSAADMIAKKLAFARTGVVQMESVVLNDYIERILASVAKVTIGENIDLKIDIVTEKLMVEMDQTQLQQLIINLLSNARDALKDRPQPEISITLTRYRADKNFLLQHNLPEVVIKPLEFAHLSVADNGCGMDEVQLAQIFEPFYTTKAIGKGTGLGLSMVYDSVQTHHGILQVASHESEGSQFDLFFPLLDLAATQKIALLAEQENVDVSRIQEKILLLVDDDKAIRLATSKQLIKEGYRIILAKDGQEAVTLFQQHVNNIDLVILDVVMPKMGGGETAEKIRLLSPDIPIIFMTGYDKDRVINNKWHLKKSLVMTKPFQHSEINSMIKTLLVQYKTKN